MMVGHELPSEEVPPGRGRGRSASPSAGLHVHGRPRHRGGARARARGAAGEIVGIAGVSGNGQRELAEAIAGLRAPPSGSIELDGIEVAGRHPAEVRAGRVSASFRRSGCATASSPGFTVAENLLLIDNAGAAVLALRVPARPRHPAALRASWSRTSTSRRRASTRPCSNLSGGNIQKLILARELSGEPRVLLVAQPIRGVDVGAASYIHERL